MTGLRRLVRDHWAALATTAPSIPGRFAVSDTAVDTPHGAVAAALDCDGGRHLLIPLAPQQTLEPDTRSNGVHLVFRELGEGSSLRRYADLLLNDPRLDDVYTSLCADVLGAVAAEPAEAVRGVKGVLSAWRSLLDAGRATLGPGGAAGLFAELVVLERVLRLDSGAVGVWTGPLGAAYDFHRLGVGVEVKATTALDGVSFRVHGLDQLDPGTGRLWLAWFRLERHPELGMSLSEAVERALDAADDHVALLNALARAGYDAASAGPLDATRYSLSEERWYAVKDNFPRLVATDLLSGKPAAGVSDVHYTVDLASTSASQVESAKVLATLVGQA